MQHGDWCLRTAAIAIWPIHSDAMGWQGTVTEKKIARIIRSILRFITQCHAKGVIYRDVKPDNFLFLSKDDNSPLRATDFGLSIR